MNDPETPATNAPTDSESQPQLREWVTPSFEQFTLKDAFAGGPTTNTLDVLYGSS